MTVSPTPNQRTVVPAETIKVQPTALMVTAPAYTTLEELNRALAAHGLWLPIVPLDTGVTLADLVARNAGGRRQPVYGTIAHYLRAATLRMDDGTLVQVGGPTLKRATGYALQRALVGGGQMYLPGVQGLVDITMNVRPLPQARAELLIACPDLGAACRLAARLHAAGPTCSALAVLDETLTEGQALLLAELEGLPAVLERQRAELEVLLPSDSSLLANKQYALDEPHESAWTRWEAVAQDWQADPTATLSLSVPRAALPAFGEQAREIGRRYTAEVALWGDAAVGKLHVRLSDSHNTRTPAELNQARLLLLHRARQMGGALSTDTPGTRWSPPAADSTEQPPAVLVGRSSSYIPSASFLVRRLQELLGEQYVFTRAGDLLVYAADASIAQGEGLPLAVVLPGSTAEVSQVLRMAADAGVPVLTRGAGSGLSGGATPVGGELVLALTRLQGMTIDAAQQVAHVEAGVVTAALQKAAQEHGLLYAPDPSSQTVSSMGGNLACNAGGPRCLKYGVTSNYVLGLTAVLADGTVRRVGDSVAGQTPDAGLMHLLLGNEGTLAVITEATLRLIRPPATRRTVLALFDRLDDAAHTVETLMTSGMLPASLELMDDTCIRVVEDARGLGLPRDAGALLLLLTDGEPEAVEWEAHHLAELARLGGARSVQTAGSAEEETSFWWARRSVGAAFAYVRPNKISEDICVPLPQVAETVRRIKDTACQYNLTIPVFGHAGDGNLHPNVLFDARDPDESARAWQAAEDVFRIALDVGGTLSGEHGIGKLKRAFLGAALGADGLALHQRIKAQFDPDGRLNPGKVL